MSLRRPLIAAVSVAGIAVLAVYAYYANRAPSAVQPVAGGPSQVVQVQQEAPPVVVEAVAAALEAMPDVATAVGTLRSNESVTLRPEVAGRISAIHFAEGGPVSRGAILIELDAAIQRAELQQARANLSLAQSNFRRTDDLFNRRFVSRSARDEAAAQLEVAQAAAELATARLERTRIRAPFDGVVGIRNVSVGDYVKEGDVLVNLEDIDTLKVDFRLPETYLERIRPGQHLEVTSDALVGRRYAATVDAIDPLVDAQGRAVVMRAKLANDGALRPGVFARVRLTLEERPGVVVVPEEALVPAPGNVRFVYVVIDGRARRVEVTTGARRDTRVEIVSGVRPGDVVVTAGQLKLRDGAPVSVLPSGPATAAGAATAG